MRIEERGKIGSFEMWCWMHMLRVPWVAKRTNEPILQQVGTTTSLLNLIAIQKLSYFSHVMRSDGLEKSIMLGMGDGSLGRGRPRTRPMDEVREMTGLLQAEGGDERQRDVEEEDH